MTKKSNIPNSCTQTVQAIDAKLLKASWSTRRGERNALYRYGLTRTVLQCLPRKDERPILPTGRDDDEECMCKLTMSSTVSHVRCHEPIQGNKEPMAG
jgi:hypothetical protein